MRIVIRERFLMKDGRQSDGSPFSVLEIETRTMHGKSASLGKEAALAAFGWAGEVTVRAAWLRRATVSASC